MSPFGMQICFVIVLLERQSIVNYSLYKGLGDIQSDPLDILNLKHWVDKLHWPNFFVVNEIVNEEIY